MRKRGTLPTVQTQVHGATGYSIPNGFDGFQLPSSVSQRPAQTKCYDSRQRATNMLEHDSRLYRDSDVLQHAEQRSPL